jgi:ethanolaminephosphotransferase
MYILLQYTLTELGWQSWWVFIWRDFHGKHDTPAHTDGQAVLFASPSFPAEDGLKSPVEPQSDFHYYTMIQQSDLVPTISTLLGWPVPRNNIGVLLKSFLRLWNSMLFLMILLSLDRTDQLAVIGNNIVQISKLVKFSRPDIFDSEYMSDCSDEGDIGCSWSRCKSSWNNKDTEKSVEDCFEVILPEIDI